MANEKYYGGGAEFDGDNWDKYPRKKQETWVCKYCGEPNNYEWLDMCSYCDIERHENTS